MGSPNDHAPLLLVIESDDAIRDALTDLLVEEGYRTEAAQSIEKGLAALKRLSGEEGCIVLLSVGREVTRARELVEALPQERISVVAMSTTSIPDSIAKHSRVIASLKMPFDSTLLLRTLRRASSGDA